MRMRKGQTNGYHLTDEKFDSILNLVDDIITNPDKYPDRFIPIPLKHKEVTEIFTKKRTELIGLIKRKQPITVTELAHITNRPITAVIRDVSLLKHLHIVSAEKKGREVILTIKQDFLVIQIVPNLGLDEIEKRKELAIA